MNNWGGKRKGAGRKRVEKRSRKRFTLNATIEPKTLRLIESEAKQLGITRGRLIDLKFQGNYARYIQLYKKALPDFEKLAKKTKFTVKQLRKMHQKEVKNYSWADISWDGEDYSGAHHNVEIVESTKEKLVDGPDKMFD